MSSTPATTSTEQLNAEQAMVLIEIEEQYEEDPRDISASLGMNIQRVIDVANSLHAKGLVVLERVSGNLYFRLSKQGKRMYRNMWPQGRMQLGA